MRFDGTLKKWNADRGTGSVVADQGGEELFVHVSAFPRDGRVPALGETLSFEIGAGRDGKKCAVQVQRRGAAQLPPTRSRRHDDPWRARPVGSRYSSESRRSDGGSRLVAIIIAAVLGWYGYSQYENRVAKIKGAPQAAIASQVTAVTPAGFPCDGRKYCSQMTSCTEAKQFLKNCPGVQMDGDGNGVPCEKQWCTGIFGN